MSDQVILDNYMTLKDGNFIRISSKIMVESSKSGAYWVQVYYLYEILT